MFHSTNVAFVLLYACCGCQEWGKKRWNVSLCVASVWHCSQAHTSVLRCLCISSVIHFSCWYSTYVCLRAWRSLCCVTGFSRFVRVFLPFMKRKTWILSWRSNSEFLINFEKKVEKLLRKCSKTSRWNRTRNASKCQQAENCDRHSQQMAVLLVATQCMRLCDGIDVAVAFAAIHHPPLAPMCASMAMCECV